MKKTKRTTIIALIITTIVMLILVAVSVTVAMNGDIFGQNKKTTKETDNNVMDNEKDIDDMANRDVNGELHNWTRTGDIIICSHCKEKYTIGDPYTYTSGGTGTSEISGELSGILAYLEYIEDKSIILNSSISLTTGNQTIIKDAETTWVVLGIEDQNNNGTNETLLITTSKPTEDKIALFKEYAYNNGIDILNKVCKDLYGENARGMTIEDVNKCLKYEPDGGEYYYDRAWHTTGNLTTRIKDLEGTWNLIKNYNNTYNDGKFYTPIHPEGIEDEGEELGNYELNGYSYWTDELTLKTRYGTLEANISQEEHDVIFGESEDYDYWMASHGVYSNSTSTNFGLGYVSSEYVFSSGPFFFDSTGEGGCFNVAVRPVISIF